MLLQTTLASATAEFGKSTSLDPFEIVLIGFLFVFSILLILSLTTWMFGKVFAHIAIEECKGPKIAGATALSSSSTTSTTDKVERFNAEADDPHYIAVIAAAVHCVMQGRRHRIISIRSSDSSWSAEGRRQIFSSHKVR